MAYYETTTWEYLFLNPDGEWTNKLSRAWTDAEWYRHDFASGNIIPDAFYR